MSKVVIDTKFLGSFVVRFLNKFVNLPNNTP